MRGLAENTGQEFRLWLWELYLVTNRVQSELEIKKTIGAISNKMVHQSIYEIMHIIRNKSTEDSNEKKVLEKLYSNCETLLSRV